jgi:hypothetical protein
MTTDQFVASDDFPGFDILKKVLEVHSDEFISLPDGRIWFNKTPVPVRTAFEKLQDALEFAFSEYPDGATIEELRRMLCLCVCDEMPITRFAIAKELTERKAVYWQIQRGKYGRIGEEGSEQRRESGVRSKEVEGRGGGEGVRTGGGGDDDEEKPFNPESFFGEGFTFAAE